MQPFFGVSLVLAILLTACQQSVSVDVPSTAQSSSSVPQVIVEPAQAQELEQLPSELTIEYFGKMQLSGTGLTLTKLTENSSYTQYAIKYLSNGLTITGIMNIPKGTGPFPLVITNHGYIDPAIYTQGRGLKREQDYLAKAGFAVLHPDYRGHAGSDKSPMAEETKIYDGGLEYAMDSANAINAVRAAGLKNVDATKIGMLGHSMGGGVTLSILTARPDLVDAAVLYAPVHADMWQNFMRWQKERPSGDRTLETYKTYDENPAAWDAFSPGAYLHVIRAPILLFHGTRDVSVPMDWSDDLSTRLQALNKNISYMQYEGEGHEFGPQWTDFMERSVVFFTRELSPE